MLARLTMLLLIVVVLSACTATRAVVNPQAKLVLIATEDVNPDLQGRASPLAIRIYQLASRTEFDTLDFDAAFLNAEAVLGHLLISTSEHIVLPKQALQHRVELEPAAEFVAVVAAYRAIDQANWRLVHPVNSNWRQSLEIQLRADGLALVE